MFALSFRPKATKLALLQSKFHRIIKHRMTAALKPFQLATVEWIVLGFLDHKRHPMAISEVSSELGIQSSFMTVIITKLVKRHMIAVSDDENDKRKKYIRLAPEGHKVVKLMQRQFEEFFTPLARGISKRDMDAYLKVITTIIANLERFNIQLK